MKLPSIPPDWSPLIQEATEKGSLDQLWRIASKESLRKDRYLAWDDFRCRVSASEGISIEQQWAFLRTGRVMRSTPLPLDDAAGKPFTFFLTERMFEALHEIDMHCGGGISVGEKGVVQKDSKDRYYVDSLIQEALTSSQLEGAAVTRSEAREMIRRDRKPRPSMSGW